MRATLYGPQAAFGEELHLQFLPPPLSTPLPPEYFTGWERTRTPTRLEGGTFHNQPERTRKIMIIGIDHGYYAIKTRHFSFPAGIAAYTHEPYTLQNTLEYGGRFFVCGTGRQPLLRSKTANDNYYLLTLAAIAKEIQRRGEKATCSVTLAAGLPLAGFGREKKVFRDYLRRSSQPVG